MTTKESKDPLPVRIYRKLLGTPQGLSKKELAESMGCDERSVQRKVAMLRELSVPIDDVHEKKQEAKRYRILPQNHPMTFTTSEIVALCTSRRFLEPMRGTELWEAVESVLAKMKKRLGEPLAKLLEDSAGAIEPAMFGQSNYEDSGEVINTLTAAAEKKHRVRILHKSFKDKELKYKKVDPYGLAYHDGSLYLFGFSHESQAIRQWKVDRISEAEELAETFEPPVDFNLAEHVSEGFGMLGIFRESGDFPVQRVRIRFRSYFTRIIQEKRWHASQKITEEPDGSVILEMELSELRILKRWVMSFGRHAEVLEPTELREMVRKEIEMTLAQYT